jgi:uncharacterized membrane protein
MGTIFFWLIILIILIIIIYFLAIYVDKEDKIKRAKEQEKFKQDIINEMKKELKK